MCGGEGSKVFSPTCYDLDQMRDNGKFTTLNLERAVWNVERNFAEKKDLIVY